MTRNAILLVIALVAAAAAGAWLSRATLDSGTPVQLTQGTLLEPAQPLPDFSLLRHDGGQATKAQLQGRWSLVFFGFTHCPDVCPTTLAKLADVRKRLADLPPAEQPQVVLVSVDPERDTAPVVADYLRGFDSSFVGLTGTPSQVDALTASLGVAHRKVPMGGDQYMVDHTSVVMLVDPQGERAAIFSAPLDAAGIAGDFRRMLASREG